MPNQTRVYNPNTTHSQEFYLQLLNALIAGNADGLSYAQIADGLNLDGIKTPSGMQWTAYIVKENLRKLRLFKSYGSKLHKALLQLILDEKLTVKQSLPLFKSRLHGTM